MRTLFALVGRLLPGAGLVTALLSGACRQDDHHEPSAPAPSTAIASVAPAVSAPTGTSPLPPLTAPEPLIHVPLAGFGPVTIALPLGADTPRPVVVALHGHAVRPEHACTNWARASMNTAFVLCPHGLPANAGPDAAVTFGSAAQTRKEIDAGWQALRDRYPQYIAAGPLVFAGYSMGAKLGVAIVHDDPGTFPLAVFGEGGYEALTPRVAEDYRRAGVRRVLLICSTKPCEPTFERTRERLQRAGVEVQLASSGGTKHMFEGAVAEVTRTHWPWLVSDDPRWTVR